MFELRCLSCGEICDIYLNISDMDTFECKECDGTWELEDVRKSIDEWTRVLAWIESAGKFYKRESS